MNLLMKTNPEIFRQCREQMGLSLEEACKKTKVDLQRLEMGETKPTFSQLRKISDCYLVPDWVFLHDKLPSDYRFVETVPQFRSFSPRQSRPGNYEIRKLLVETSALRRTLLDFREDLEAIPRFSPPAEVTDDFIVAAQKVRHWLRDDDHDSLSLSFDKWKKFVEDKNVFVYVAPKSRHREGMFRGFSLYEETLPMIVINGADANPAQSFTLFHELGHLLRKENGLDDKQAEYLSDSEQWCDHFAGEVLMPRNLFVREVDGFGGSRQEQIKKIRAIARKFKVSSYACAVKLRLLEVINQEQLQDIKNELLPCSPTAIDKMTKAHNKTRRVTTMPTEPATHKKICARQAKKAYQQYGDIYVRTALQAYYDEAIGLHKLCQMLDIKYPDAVFMLEKMAS